MTLQELYQSIGGDYDQAIRVLRVEKLIDKHIRKYPAGGVAAAVIAAGENMDGQALFEAAHAMKGVCGNLGLRELAELASAVTEEFRPGNPRTMTDGEVREILRRIGEENRRTVQGISAYTGA